jgi:hypothetical protein
MAAQRAGKLITRGTLIVCALIFYVELFSGTKFDVSAAWFLVIAIAAFGLSFVSIVALAQKRRIGLVGLAASAIAMSWSVLSFGPGGDRIISQINAADGTEMCLLHQHNANWAEPYSISFCYRKPGQAWKKMYYDHQDLRWWFGEITVDESGKRAVVRRFILPVAYFDIATEQFTIARREQTYSGDSAAMPPTWTPEEEIRH